MLQTIVPFHGGGPWDGAEITLPYPPSTGFQWSKRSEVIKQVVHEYEFSERTGCFEYSGCYLLPYDPKLQSEEILLPAEERKDEPPRPWLYLVAALIVAVYIVTFVTVMSMR